MEFGESTDAQTTRISGSYVKRYSSYLPICNYCMCLLANNIRWQAVNDNPSNVVRWPFSNVASGWLSLFYTFFENQLLCRRCHTHTHHAVKGKEGEQLEYFRRLMLPGYYLYSYTYCMYSYVYLRPLVYIIKRCARCFHLIGSRIVRNFHFIHA